jgi:hypothetical protein
MDSTAQTTPMDSEITKETASKGNARIRQRKQPLGAHNSSMKLLSQLTHGFDSANGRYGLRNCCDVTAAQINYPSFKHNTQDSIEQARGRSHEEVSSQIFMLYVM